MKNFLLIDNVEIELVDCEVNLMASVHASYLPVFQRSKYLKRENGLVKIVLFVVHLLFWSFRTKKSTKNISNWVFFQSDEKKSVVSNFLFWHAFCKFKDSIFVFANMHFRDFFLSCCPILRKFVKLIIICSYKNILFSKFEKKETLLVSLCQL